MRFDRLAAEAVLGPLSLVIQPPIKVERGADERQMREGLWEVAEMLPARAKLLSVQAEMVGVPKHLLQDERAVRQQTGQ